MECQKDLLSNLKQVGQEHLLKFYDEISDELKNELISEISATNLETLSKIFAEQVANQVDSNGHAKPVAKVDEKTLSSIPSDSIGGHGITDDATIEEYRRLGSIAIGKRKVAALLLAGGQGTRLGVSYPKGMFDIGLESRKSLFELQANRIDDRKNILEVRQALQEAKENPDETPIRWYIMTSGPTRKQTEDFFERNGYFGLSRHNVIMFEQNTIPSFDFSGKILLDEKYKLAKSPNGNGGLYEVLHEKGIIADMIEHGVEYVHTYCVDNVLVRVCDPVFLGYCISKGVEVGAKVVEKVNPNESVGIICKVSDKIKVIEYSEISDEIAGLRDQDTGKLIYRSGNICDHFFKVSFLKSLEPSKHPLPYHIALKKIPHINLDSGERVCPSKPNGIKLERFIFDVFELTRSFCIWQVDREIEFSPLKNPIDSEKDNPTTALESLRRAMKLGIKL